MKPSWGLLLSSLFCAASAASKPNPGHVYVYDPTTKSKDTTQQSPVTPETARLIIAQRLGLSRYHSLKNVDDEVIQLLNQYGGQTQKLFGQDRERNHAHALLWLDGVEDPSHIMDKAASTEYLHFTISNPPSSTANEKLVNDLLAQAEFSPKRSDPQLTSYNSDTVIFDILHGVKQENHISVGYWNLQSSSARSLPVGSVENHDTRGEGADFALKQTTSRKEILALFSAAKTHGFSLTVVLTPPTAGSYKKHPYGVYTLPSHRLQARRQVPEAILSSSAAISSNAANTINNTETTPNLPLAKTGPLLGILKSCYESQSACESATRNCTGHGACHLLRRGEQLSGGNGKNNDCFSCACTATVVQRGEGKGHKTTNWGGPACQKKDVVVEFWLFAGATVMLMFLVGSGIGMLYSMGEEELPSVIGAGVSGPTRK